MKKINDSILLKKMANKWLGWKGWSLWNNKLAYNKEMDQLVETNIISSNVEEEDFVACPNGRMKESDGEMEESHDEK